MIREKAIETRLRKQVEKRGGLCLKFVSPGNKGVPDRIVIFQGICHFVELKAPEGRLTAIQKRQHERLASRGFDVHVLYTKEQVDVWVDLNASIAERLQLPITDLLQ